MTDATWLPGLLVLAAGFLVGTALAFKLRRSRDPGNKKKKSRSISPDLTLQLRDLEARRDDLYRRIRAAEEDKLGAAEVADLENAAARTLLEIDRLQDELPKGMRREARQSPAAAAAEPAAAPRQEARSRHPLLTGVAIAGAMVLVVVLLVYWAIRDAQPAAPTGPQPMAGTSPPHETQGEIPPELAAQAADLENRLLNEPQDLMARKQLALTYVATGQFFEAFEQATQVLEVEPQDPDGLLVHGMVRLTMGQTDQAVALLDQVLAQYPDHRQALIYRGLALYQGGKVEQAMDTWDMGLQMAGGSDPEFEELILMAQSGAAQPPGMSAPGSGSSPAPQPSVPAAAVTTDPESYNLTVQLAQGIATAPQATLFVFLRPEEGGPPIAVRRIPTPRFPISLALGIADSMMGDDLPEAGILVAKLDWDGNVASAHAEDLQSESAARKGEVLQLTLGR